MTRYSAFHYKWRFTVFPHFIYSLTRIKAGPFCQIELALKVEMSLRSVRVISLKTSIGVTELSGIKSSVLNKKKVIQTERIGTGKRSHFFVRNVLWQD